MMNMIVGLVMCCKSCSMVPMSNDTFPSKSRLVLPEIQIKGNAMVAKRRGDTLIFAADKFKRPEAIRLEQLLSNVPGFQVDEHGKISFNGKPIQKLMLDGDDLTAENYQLISRNLRSLLIDSIQVLEQYSDNRLLKGLSNQKSIAINLVLKTAFYGKPTVNVNADYAPPKNSELQAELIYLQKKNKQFVLANANNLGAYPIPILDYDETRVQLQQHLLFRSWPLVLMNDVQNTIPDKYVNLNHDWGFSLANTVRINKQTQLRITLTTLNQYIENRRGQQQVFTSQSLVPIVLDSRLLFQKNSKITAGALEWVHDRGKNANTRYQLQFYHELHHTSTDEERELGTKNLQKADVRLLSKGIKFDITHTWKPTSNRVWIITSTMDGSLNRYSIFAAEKGNEDFDSIGKSNSQAMLHSGFALQTGIAHQIQLKKLNLQFWMRSSLAKLDSKQGRRLLDLFLVKHYLSGQLAKSISKKITLEVQSMLGQVQYRLNQAMPPELIYHIDKAFVWRKKPTQQLSVNIGILKQALDVRKIYAGGLFVSGTTQINGPETAAFPRSIYAQFNYSTIDLYRGLTIAGQLIFKEIRGDYFMSVDLLPAYTTLIQLANGSQSMRSLNIQIEKIIHPIRMKYRIQGGFIYSKNLVVFNKQPFDVKNQMYRLGNFLTTNWRKRYNFQLEYQHVRSLFNLYAKNKSVWAIRNEVKAGIQFNVRKDLHTTISLHRYSGPAVRPLNLFDCSLNWIYKSTYRFYLKGNNLLNMKQFSQQFVQANSITTSIQQMIGRRIILGLDIPF